MPRTLIKDLTSAPLPAPQPARERDYRNILESSTNPRLGRPQPIIPRPGGGPWPPGTQPLPAWDDNAGGNGTAGVRG